MDPRTFNVLSLCSGVGGLDLGIRLAVGNARTVCFVERESYCCEVLVERMEDEALDEAPIWTNLKTFDGRPWRGVVDCVAGGYPCQPFSNAGKRRGEADPRHLWPDIVRILDEVRPDWAFFENVSGHLSLGFRKVVADLSSMDYRVAAGVFSALEVGGSHERERLFIMANRPDVRCEPGEIPGTGYSRKTATQSKREIGRVLESQRKGAAPLRYPPGPGSPEWGRIGREYPALLPSVEHPHSRGESEIETVHRRGVRDRPGTAGPGDDLCLGGKKDSQPELHGMADGLADRVDRIRACGNGVVPDVAALAWTTLYKSLTER